MWIQNFNRGVHLFGILILLASCSSLKNLSLPLNTGKQEPVVSADSIVDPTDAVDQALHSTLATELIEHERFWTVTRPASRAQYVARCFPVGLR